MPIVGDKYGFTQANVDVSPDEQGVYALFQNGVLIYYGKGDNSIRVRLQSHFAGREGPCTKAADIYMRERCNNAAARERQLLQEYRAANGRLPRCNEVMP